MRVKVYNNRLKVYGGRVKYNYPNESKAVVDGIQTTDQLNSPQRLYAHFIVGMEINESIWTKNTALYGMLGGTAAAHKWNWKDMRDLDEAFRLSYSGTQFHSNNGVQSSATINTNLTTNLLTKDNTHLSIYINSNISPNSISATIGSFNSSGRRNWIVLRSNVSAYESTGAGSLDVIVSAAFNYNQSYIIGNSNGISSRRFLKNGINIPATSTGNRGDDINYSDFIGILGVGSAYDTASTASFSTVGAGLTDTQAIQMSNIITFAQKMRANF